MKPICAFVVFLLITAACKPEETVVPAEPEQLAGDWKLIEPVSTYQISLRLAQDTATLSVIPFGFRLSGESSINCYSGVFSYNAGNLMDARSQVAISRFGSTQRGGSSEAMQFEQVYFTHLRAANRYDLTDQNHLRLYYGGAQPGVLVYNRMN